MKKRRRIEWDETIGAHLKPDEMPKSVLRVTQEDMARLMKPRKPTPALVRLMRGEKRKSKR